MQIIRIPANSNSTGNPKNSGGQRQKVENNQAVQYSNQTKFKFKTRTRRVKIKQKEKSKLEGRGTQNQVEPGRQAE